MNIPMREKYVDEAVGTYFEFGYSKDDDTVDVSDGSRDVFTSLPKPVAELVCEAHARFKQELYNILCKSKEVSKNET